MVLFQLRDRAAEKVIKTHKINIPDTDYAPNPKAAPSTRTRRCSTTSAAACAMTTANTTTFPGKYHIHDPSKFMPATTQESFMANTNSKLPRGGSSHKHSNVSSSLSLFLIFYFVSQCILPRSSGEDTLRGCPSARQEIEPTQAFSHEQEVLRGRRRLF
jgi:hypothetical protein